jgi:hypothetical protein
MPLDYLNVITVGETLLSEAKAESNSRVRRRLRLIIRLSSRDSA